MRFRLFLISLLYTFVFAVAVLGVVMSAGIKVVWDSWFTGEFIGRVAVMALVVQGSFLTTAGHTPFGWIAERGMRRWVFSIGMMFIMTIFLDVVTLAGDGNGISVLLSYGTTSLTTIALRMISVGWLIAMMMVLPAAWAPKFAHYDGRGYIPAFRATKFYR